eukprot:5323632-Lingulodinium_polyedra.AAC.1
MRRTARRPPQTKWERHERQRHWQGDNSTGLPHATTGPAARNNNSQPRAPATVAPEAMAV